MRDAGRLARSWEQLGEYVSEQGGMGEEPGEYGGEEKGPGLVAIEVESKPPGGEKMCPHCGKPM